MLYSRIPHKRPRFFQSLLYSVTSWKSKITGFPRLADNKSPLALCHAGALLYYVQVNNSVWLSWISSFMTEGLNCCFHKMLVYPGNIFSGLSSVLRPVTRDPTVFYKFIIYLFLYPFICAVQGVYSSCRSTHPKLF